MVARRAKEMEEFELRKKGRGNWQKRRKSKREQ
jgi:hypothetical protein